MNISSVIVIPHPDSIRDVEERLAEVAGVEVHAVSPEGKIIATIETDDDTQTTQLYEYIGLMDGVMSVSMVYHQNESNPETVISVEA